MAGSPFGFLLKLQKGVPFKKDNPLCSTADTFAPFAPGVAFVNSQGLRAELDALKSLLDEGPIRMRSSVCRRRLGL